MENGDPSLLSNKHVLNSPPLISIGKSRKEACDGDTSLLSVVVMQGKYF